MSADVRVESDLWANNCMPEGSLERWRASEGASVTAGQAIAEVRIEDALHELVAPAAGRLYQLVSSGAMIEPGALIARITAISDQGVEEVS